MQPIKPIRTEMEYEAVVAEIDELFDAEEGPEADRLEVLAILAEAYEKEHHAIDAPDPVSAVEFALDQGMITRKQLEKALGGRNRVSEFFAGKRGLSIAMIRELAGLGLPLVSLIAEVPKKTRRQWAYVKKGASITKEKSATYRISKPSRSKPLRKGK